MKKKQTYLLLAACVLIAGCATGPTGPPDVLRRPQTPAGRGVWGETKIMPTRPGVEQRVLIVRPDGKAKGSVLLFRGGDGSQPFSEVSDGFLTGSGYPDLYRLDHTRRRIRS